MSIDKQLLLNPLFLKYQADYEKNPRSRVFAPLAETYRKLGMTEKAMEILSQGIRFHPTYVMGYLGLAFCYFDIRQFVLAYNTLRPLVESNRDNIRLQKLFADICVELKHSEEALETYKYLLFINPRDKEIALRVQELEEEIESRYQPNHQPIYIPENEFKSEGQQAENDLFDVSKLDPRPIAAKEDFDDWMALDLNRLQKNEKKNEDEFDKWNLNKGVTHLPVEETQEVDEEISFNFDSEAVSLKEKVTGPQFIIEEDEDVIEDSQPSKDFQSVPMVTHTLVDLYCGQGHIEKALEVLERILILNPRDQKTIDKIAEIKKLMGDIEQYPEPKKVEKEKAKIKLETLKDATEEDGRKNLMDILDQKLSLREIDLEIEEEIVEEEQEVEEASDDINFDLQSAHENEETIFKMQRKTEIEEKLNKFLLKIKERALDYQMRI